MATTTVAAGLDVEKVNRLLAKLDTPDANFADSFIGDAAVRQIADALFNNSSKTRVFLDRNCIGADGAAALGDMLKVFEETFYFIFYVCSSCSTGDFVPESRGSREGIHVCKFTFNSDVCIVSPVSFFLARLVLYCLRGLHNLSIVCENGTVVTIISV